MLLKKNSEKIIILGLNETSLTLANRLSKNNDIVILKEEATEISSVIDADVLIEKIETGLLSTLKSIELKDTSLFIALSNKDEYNLFAASLVKSLGVKKTIAKVNDYNYLNINKEIDLIFNPNQIILDHISSKIKETKLLNIHNLIPAQVNISEIMVKQNDFFSYIKLKNVSLNEGLIIAIKRKNKMLIASEDTVIFPGDKLFVLYKNVMFNKLIKSLKKHLKKKKLYILGGSSFSLTCVEFLHNLFASIVIIEPDLEKCNLLAARLEKTLILHGEGTNFQLLREEGLNETSSFLACSQDDRQNLLSSFVVKKMGCKNIITLLIENTYQEIVPLLKLENVLIVSNLITNYIINFLDTGFKLNKYILGEKVFTSIIKLKSNSKYIKESLNSLTLPKGIKIGAIIRNNRVILANKNLNLQAKDKLIIFFYQDLEERLHHIF